MNIKELKVLVANLPDEISPEQFSLIEQDVEALLAEQRRADEAELEATIAKANKLQEKLGVKFFGPQMPRVAVEGSSKHSALHSELDETDAGQGIRESRDEGVSAQDFRDELAELRERTAMKRRRL